jgi:hypothetical protein
MKQRFDSKLNEKTAGPMRLCALRAQGQGQGRGQGRGQEQGSRGGGFGSGGPAVFSNVRLRFPPCAVKGCWGVVDLLFIVKGKPLRGRCATLDYKQPIHCRGIAFDSPWREHETTF